jgi:hypothetical protein
MALASFYAQAHGQSQILLYEECGSVTLDLRTRMITLCTLIVVFLELIRKSLRSVCYISCEKILKSDIWP